MTTYDVKIPRTFLARERMQETSGRSGSRGADCEVRPVTLRSPVWCETNESSKSGSLGDDQMVIFYQAVPWGKTQTQP
jgi:hypothetical protein